MTRCKHCATNKVTRPRGLCGFCYHAPGVRARYPSANRTGLGHARGPLAPEPTAAPPGSPAKVAVLAARVASGFAPFHPADSPADEE